MPIKPAANYNSNSYEPKPIKSNKASKKNMFE